MNSSDIALTASTVMSDALDQAAGTGLARKVDKAQSSDATFATAKKTEQAAKDFESVLLTKILEGMENTVSQFSAEDKEAGSEQVKGLFTLFLARDMADKGGLGLWKDLNTFFKDMQKTNNTSQAVDEKL